MTVSDLQATVTIGGNSMSGSIVSVTREHSLNNVGQTFSVVLDELPVAIDPWDEVVITEQGTTVLTGYVGGVTVERAPPQVVVTGQDTWKRALDLFVDDNLYTHNESVAFWIAYVCGLAGLSYSLASPGGDLLVGEEVPLGLRPVSDVLFTLAARAQWNILVLGDGTVEFNALELGDAEHDLTDFEEGEYEVGDRDTRTEAKVWGWDEQPESPGGSMLYQDTRVVDGVGEGRVMVFANPMIDTLSEAQDMATAALNHFGNLDEISRVDLPGDPTRVVGDIGVAEVLAGTQHTQFITDLRAITDATGYRNNITLGRKNFLLPFFDTQEVEDGEPSDPVVEEVSVLGRCNAIASEGLFIYAAGYEGSSGSHIYRLEKRLSASGTLLWAISDLYASGTMADMRGVWADSQYVYTVGKQSGHSLLGDMVVTEWNASDGTENWHEVYPITNTIASDSTQRIKGDTTGLYCLTGNKFWLGVNSTAVLQKLSRVDGAVIWEADSFEIPDLAFPLTSHRFYSYDLDTDNAVSYVLVVGATNLGFDNLTTNFTKSVWVSAIDKGTGAFVWQWETDLQTLTNGFRHGVLDETISGTYWAIGQHAHSTPTATLDQVLSKLSNAAELDYLGGPHDPSTVDWQDVVSGLTYIYDTWIVSNISYLRAATKGTVQEQWILTLPTDTRLYGLEFNRSSLMLWGGGEQNGFFYVASRTV